MAQSVRGACCFIPWDPHSVGGENPLLQVTPTSRIVSLAHVQFWVPGPQIETEIFCLFNLKSIVEIKNILTILCSLW